MKSFRHIAILTVLLLVGIGAKAQKTARQEYIERYAPLAVEQQTLYGIPASITLAQGLLESGNGTSRLAREANNHFGIKCGSSWDGESIRHDDDALQECFRAYSSVEESFIDHSLILLERKWYRPLFDLDPKDYKAWAHGLKKAGYATNPRYADLLIKIIEDYELYRYDNTLVADWQHSTPQTQQSADGTQKADNATVVEIVEPKRIDVDNLRIALHSVGGYGIYSNGARRYVIASDGDNLAHIANAVGISARRLRKLNKIESTEAILSGERIFIE